MPGRTGAGVAGATGVTGLTTGTGTGGFGGMILSTIGTTTIPRSDGAARSGRPAGINSNSRTTTLSAIAQAPAALRATASRGDEAAENERSEERRVGKECGSRSRIRGQPYK